MTQSAIPKKGTAVVYQKNSLCTKLFYQEESCYLVKQSNRTFFLRRVFNGLCFFILPHFICCRICLTSFMLLIGEIESI
ncbi:hypothetical protein BD560DRAFT_408479 [Blakeslea trispora]|nr:hypothetical protein BD560DRAFT_408479 [Blakeslea trispora]